MDSVDIVELFRAQPFEPFVVHMNNGSAFEVRHPEQAMLHGEVLHVSTREGIQRCALLNIAHIATKTAA
ncbi:MAG: hypothetical protein ACRCT8_09050 [Lacipirellulaceae bacterium]